jgi:hypothetical protein
MALHIRLAIGILFSHLGWVWGVDQSVEQSDDTTVDYR